jgi:hypothetical protein
MASLISSLMFTCKAGAYLSGAPLKTSQGQNNLAYCELSYITAVKRLSSYAIKLYNFSKKLECFFLARNCKTRLARAYQGGAHYNDLT